MSMEAQFTARCDVNIAETCRKVEIIERTAGANDRLPLGIVPPGWTQNRAGQLSCPECTAAANV